LRASLLLAAGLWVFAAGAQANVIKVAASAVSSGGSTCSLVDAINAANSNAKSGNCPAGDDKTNGGDVIVLSAGVYKIGTADDDWYGPNGLPPITSKITIVGDPQGTIIMRSANTGVSAFRIFYVGGGQSLSHYNPPQDGNGTVVSTTLPGPGNLTLINLTLQNGLAQGGAGGSSTLGGGGGGLGAGGAIYNQGTLTLQGVTLAGNQAVGGAGGSNSSTTTSTLAGGGGGMSGAGDGFGDGGGFNSNGAWPDNTTPAGEFGNGGGPSQAGGVGGGGGNGKAGGFGGGGGGSGGAGGFGGGEGFGSFSPGFGGGFGLIASGGGAGLGGAIFNDGGTVTVQNCTFTANNVTGGASGAGSTVALGQGDAFGAAIFNLDGKVTVTYSTLAGNTLVGAAVSAGAVYNLLLGTPGSPAADASAVATLDADSSILYGSEQLTTDSSGNTTSSAASDCENNGGSLSGGHDVLGPTSAACILAGDLFTNPDLLPLASNGGPTSTMAIFFIGSAFGAGNTATAPLLDQRGYLRDAGPDIGAYEVSNTPIAIPAISGLRNATAIAGGSASQQAFNLSGNTVAQPHLTVALASSDTSILPAANLTLSANCGASLAQDACSLSAKPTAKTLGTAVVNVTATNGYGQTGYASFTQTVIPPAPVAKDGSQTVASGQTLNGTLSASEALNATLSYSIVTQPQHGTVKITGGSAFTYTPANGYIGSDSFTWLANDGSLDSNTAKESITVTLPPPPPGAPTVSNLSFNVTENTAFNGTLTVTGSSGFTVAVGTKPGHGSVKITNTATGAFTYTPASGFTGSDSFTYTATDTLLKATSNPATVTLSVSTTGGGGSSSGGSSSGGGSSGGGGGSSGGSSSGGSGSSGANSVAPIASAQSLTTYAGTPVKGTLAASDAGGNAMSFAATQPAHGSVSVTSATGAFSYSPAAGFTGSDSFSFTATDSVSKLVSAAAQVSVTVTAIPVSSKAVPLVGNGSFTTYENVAVTGQLSASDAAGNALNYLRVTPPAHGIVNVTSATGAFSYTPTTGYVGTDSFTFSVTDSVTTVASTVATVSLTMVALPPAAPAAPVANDAAYTLYENPASAPGFTAAVTASEAAGDPLTYSVSTAPAHGGLGAIASDGSFTYTPNPNFIGTDSFQFKANDATTTKSSDPATITFTVSALPPPAPIAANLSVATYQGVTVAGVLPASDGNGNALTYASTLPAQGVLTLNTGTGGFTYAPTVSYVGPDSFTFTVSDNITHALSTPATVTLSVDPVPGGDPTTTAPLANNASVTVYENTALNSQVTGASAGSNTLAYTVLTLPNHGVVSLTSGTGAYTYTPTATYTGADSFTFSVKDNGNNLTANATVSITVAAAPPPATPPQVSDATFTLYQDQPLSGLLVAADAAGNPVNFSVVQPAHGSLTLTATSGAFTYTPNAGFTGSDSFSYTAIDTVTSTASSAATVTLTVSATPITGVAPLASGASVSVYQGQVLSGKFAAVTVGGDALSYALKTQPAHGSLKLTAASGAYSYSPTAGYAGKDSFGFVATDKTTHLMSNTGTIAVTVVAPPLQAVAPLANGLALSVYSGQPINSAVSAVDVNGNPVAYAVTTKPKNGSLTLQAGDGGFSYTPAAGFTGSDSFAYTATDTVTKLASSAAQVEITVVPAPPAPTHHGGPSLTGKGSYGGVGLLLLSLLLLWRRLQRRRWMVPAAFAAVFVPATVLSDDAPAPYVQPPITDAWYVGGDANLVKADSKRDASGGGFKGWGLLVGRDLGNFALEFDGEYHADAPQTLGGIANWKTFGAGGLWYFQEHKSDAFSPFLDGGAGLAYQYRGDDSKQRSSYLKFGAGFNSAPWRTLPVRFRVDASVEHVFSGYNDLLLSLGVEIAFGGTVPPPPNPAMPQASPLEQYPMAWCAEKGGLPTETDAGWVCDLPGGRTETQPPSSAPSAATVPAPSTAPAAGTLSTPSVVTYPQPPAALR